MVISCIRSQRENRLGPRGAFTEGDLSPQTRAACSSIVWALDGGILVVLLLGETNLTRKLKTCGPKFNRSRKAAEAQLGEPGPDIGS